MTDDMKAAGIACLVLLPILFGVGWLADIITRGMLTALVVSKDGGVEALRAVQEPILPQMILALLGMWVVVSAIAMLMAWAGLGRLHAPPRIPPPPPWRAEH